jgi:UDP-glucose:(heptosyl)LPS alpha-1,3-glucosyltransferase
VKIALVHKQFTLQGGTERYLVGLACFLAERGHDVHVFCSKLDPVLSGLRGIHFHRLRVPRLGGLIKLIGMWLMTRLAIKRDEFDVVQGFGRTTGHDVLRFGGGCHRTYLEGVLARASSSWERLRLQLDPRQWLMMRIERAQLADRGVRRLLLVSERCRRELLDRYPAEAAKAPLEVLHNGVDTQRFHPKNRGLFFTEAREQYHLVPEDTVVLFVGSDWDRKGLDVAMRAMSRLSDRPDVKLLVAGADRRFDRYTELADGLGVRDTVYFTGQVERMERVYATADVMLLPTRYDPFANVTLEALASELPVVTSGVNGAVEVVGDCEAVRVVDDPEDDEGMASALCALLDHPAPEKLRIAAREAAEEHRDRANFERVEAIYREMAGAGRGTH